MLNILTGLGSPWGKLGVIGAIILALAGWRLSDLHKQRGIGEARANYKMEKAADANAQKANRARHSVDSIPDSRLRDKYFRD